MALAAAEVAVVTGAGGAKGVRAVVCSSGGVGAAARAAGSGGWGHDCNGWQAASVRAAVGSRCGMHATACSRAACVRQHAAAASGWEQPAAQLQWKTVMAAGKVVVQRAVVDSYFLLMCGIFTQALCTR